MFRPPQPPLHSHDARPQVQKDNSPDFFEENSRTNPSDSKARHSHLPLIGPTFPEPHLPRPTPLRERRPIPRRCAPVAAQIPKHSCLPSHHRRCHFRRSWLGCVERCCGGGLCRLGVRGLHDHPWADAVGNGGHEGIQAQAACVAYWGSVDRMHQSTVTVLLTR
jgi:hypothetical protein